MFKVGDEVRVKEDLIIGKLYEGVVFSDEMCGFEGREFVIYSVHKYNKNKEIFVYMLDGTSCYCWTDAMLEQIKEDTMNKFETIAKLLGVEMGEEFKVIREDGTLMSDTYKITDKGLICDDVAVVYTMLGTLLCDKYTIKKLPWEPKNGERYYYFDLEDIFNTLYSPNDSGDIFNTINGITFKTEEEAEEMRLKVLEFIKKERGLID